MIKLATVLMCVLAISACGRSKGGKSSPRPSDVPTADGSGKGDDGKKDDGKKDDGKKDDGKKDDGGGEPAALTCEQQWDKYVEWNDADEFTHTLTKTVSTFNGGSTESEAETTSTVVASSNDQVEWKYLTVSMGMEIPSNHIVTRGTFVTNCEIQEDQEKEEGDATVEVPAGTFETHWVKTKYETGGAVTVVKTYMAKAADGEPVIVKTESDMTMDAGTSKSVGELLETNKL